MPLAEAAIRALRLIQMEMNNDVISSEGMPIAESPIYRGEKSVPTNPRIILCSQGEISRSARNDMNC